MRNRKTLFSSLFIALFLCTIPQIFAADLHVSNASGNDGNDGSSWGLAKKTIMAAVTAASSGDNILIEGGTYQEQVVFGNKSLTVTGSLNSGGTRTVINAGAPSSASNSEECRWLKPSKWVHIIRFVILLLVRNKVLFFLICKDK